MSRNPYYILVSSRNKFGESLISTNIPAVRMWETMRVLEYPDRVEISEGGITSSKTTKIQHHTNTSSAVIPLHLAEKRYFEGDDFGEFEMFKEKITIYFE